MRMSSIAFERDFDPAHGQAVPIGDNVRRLTAPNGGPFTFHGTNTYVVGRGRVAVIDPGPDDPDHIEAILRATTGEEISHIVITHTHRDHSPGAALLKARTGAMLLGEGPHRLARPLALGEIHMLDASGDMEFVPDRHLVDGERIEGDGWALTAIATPGHAANHLAFALEDSPLLFSGDHVMKWATTIVAPPDGAMTDYMASLDRLAERPETIYLPGHGGPVEDAPGFVRALKAHRRMREAAIVERIARGDRRIGEIVAAIYRDTPQALHGAAALSVLAHLEDLVGRDKLRAPEGVTLTGRFEPAG
jgi:glyoxylase-like metal-dependent hydrolase (beta-lactamase superfamily II)